MCNRQYHCIAARGDGLCQWENQCMLSSVQLIAVLHCVVAVPVNFHDVLMHYTAQGHRVIGLAHKPLASLSYVKVQRSRRLVHRAACVLNEFLANVCYLAICCRPSVCLCVCHL